jgi:DNA-binding beta-propeller fold protein YncE
MTLLVTSAAGANGAGYGKILAFADDGKPIGVFGDDPNISDPRGLGIDRVDKLLFVNSGSNRILALDRNGVVVRASRTVNGLNPGGGNVGPDGRYYVGLRGERTIMAFSRELNSAGEFVLPPHVVPFPRGFAFGGDGTLFLASGVGRHSEGDNTVLAFGSDRLMLPSWKVRDPELSPLDLAIAPNGNIVVSSEHPFGSENAITTIREYDHADARLVRVLVPARGAQFRKPRGLRFGAHARLYCVAQDEVVAFDFETGDCLGAVVRLPGLNGQAAIFFP